MFIISISRVRNHWRAPFAHLRRMRSGELVLGKSLPAQALAEVHCSSAVWCVIYRAPHVVHHPPLCRPSCHAPSIVRCPPCAICCPSLHHAPSVVRHSVIHHLSSVIPSSTICRPSFRRPSFRHPPFVVRHSVICHLLSIVPSSTIRHPPFHHPPCAVRHLS